MNNCHEVYIIPNLFNINKNIDSIYKLIIKQKINFIIPELHLSYKDLFYSIISALKVNNFFLKDIYFQKINVTSIFKEVQLNERLSQSTINCLMNYRLLKIMHT